MKGNRCAPSPARRVRVKVLGCRPGLSARAQDIQAAEARVELYRRAGWELRPGEVTPPKTSWLERYPNERLAKWGARFARLQASGIVKEDINEHKTFESNVGMVRLAEKAHAGRKISIKKATVFYGHFCVRMNSIARARREIVWFFVLNR